MMLRLVAITVIAACLVDVSQGNGFLADPPMRSILWRLGYFTPPNYNYHTLNCGGFEKQKENGGKCGVCGDPWNGERQNEAGGLYANGIITRQYTTGSDVTMTVNMLAPRGGYFELRLCPVADPSMPITQECLDRNPLEILNGQGTRYPVEGELAEHHGTYNMSVRLPAGVTCSHCVIQWRYHAANHFGTNPDGRMCVGCGPQPELFNCADVAILPGAGSTPSATIPRVEVSAADDVKPTIPVIPDTTFGQQGPGDSGDTGPGDISTTQGGDAETGDIPAIQGGDGWPGDISTIQGGDTGPGDIPAIRGGDGGPGDISTIQSGDTGPGDIPAIQDGDGSTFSIPDPSPSNSPLHLQTDSSEAPVEDWLADPVTGGTDPAPTPFVDMGTSSSQPQPPFVPNTDPSPTPYDSTSSGTSAPIRDWPSTPYDSTSGGTSVETFGTSNPGGSTDISTSYGAPTPTNDPGLTVPETPDGSNPFVPDTFFEDMLTEDSVQGTEPAIPTETTTYSTVSDPGLSGDTSSMTDPDSGFVADQGIVDNQNDAGEDSSATEDDPSQFTDTGDEGDVSAVSDSSKASGSKSRSSVPSKDSESKTTRKSKKSKKKSKKPKGPWGPWGSPGFMEQLYHIHRARYLANQVWGGHGNMLGAGNWMGNHWAGQGGAWGVGMWPVSNWGGVGANGGNWGAAGQLTGNSWGNTLNQNAWAAGNAVNSGVNSGWTGTGTGTGNSWGSNRNTWNGQQRSLAAHLPRCNSNQRLVCQGLGNFANNLQTKQYCNQDCRSGGSCPINVCSCQCAYQQSLDCKYKTNGFALPSNHQWCNDLCNSGTCPVQFCDCTTVTNW